MKYLFRYELIYKIFTSTSYSITTSEFRPLMFKENKSYSIYSFKKEIEKSQGEEEVNTKNDSLLSSFDAKQAP